MLDVGYREAILLPSMTVDATTTKTPYSDATQVRKHFTDIFCCALNFVSFYFFLRCRCPMLCRPIFYHYFADIFFAKFLLQKINVCDVMIHLTVKKICWKSDGVHLHLNYSGRFCIQCHCFWGNKFNFFGDNICNFLKINVCPKLPSIKFYVWGYHKDSHLGCLSYFKEREREEDVLFES